MASWRFFAFLLFVSSRISVGFSQDLADFLEGTNSIIGHEGGQIPECMQKILPCQPYIKLPENPSPMCCLPLKEMLAGDIPCLCSFFNNAELLKALNVTQTQALMLPKACGADVDISACNHGANSPSGSREAPPPPPPPAARPSTGSSTSKPNSSTRNNPGYGIGYGFAAASSFMALLLSAF